MIKNLSIIKWFEALLHFAFPIYCLGCGNGPNLLCEKCLETLPIHQHQACPLCYAFSSWGEVCDSCLNNKKSDLLEWQLDGLFVLCPYQKLSLLQTIIEQMKYHHGYPLAEILGKWMVNHSPTVWVQFLHQEQFEVVAVPLHTLRYQKRGYNQAELLAREFTNLTLLGSKKPLRRHRDTPPQAQLSREKRIQNVADAFSLVPEFPNPYFLNKKFILIDDVCSTGATLNACAAALKSAGAASVWGLVLARG